RGIRRDMGVFEYGRFRIHVDLAGPGDDLEFPLTGTACRSQRQWQPDDHDSRPASETDPGTRTERPNARCFWHRELCRVGVAEAPSSGAGSTATFPGSER